MKNKNDIIKFGLLALGIIIIIVGLILLGTNSNNNSSESSDNSNKEEPNSKEIIYVCENKIDDVNYISYQIETVYVEDGIVQKTVPSMKVVCDNKDIYNVFKNDKEYSEGKKFDNSSLTITFPNGEEVSLTEDVNGNKIKTLFSDYENNLNEVGYTCQEK